jgi:hypothetical protein
MISRALTLALLPLLAAAPRGLAKGEPVDFVAAVDQQLPELLKGGKARAALLANKGELAALAAKYPFSPADQKAAVKGMLADQAIKPALLTFNAARALLVRTDEGTQTLSFFDDERRRCEVSFFEIAGGRLVLTVGPLTDGKPVDALAKQALGPVLFFEKKDGKWTAADVPTPAPPSCDERLKAAGKAVYIAEKAHYAEFDTYSQDAKQLGLTLEAGVTLTIQATGAAETAKFSAELALKDGRAKVTEASGAVTVTKPCSP